MKKLRIQNSFNFHNWTQINKKLSVLASEDRIVERSGLSSDQARITDQSFLYSMTLLTEKDKMQTRTGSHVDSTDRKDFISCSTYLLQVQTIKQCIVCIYSDRQVYLLCGYRMTLHSRNVLTTTICFFTDPAASSSN